ncbi:MAG: hypothetical protein IJO50_05075, partial [Clostridia bacterium]|nr:hypothetical protein [Clostridia bacterium]
MNKKVLLIAGGGTLGSYVTKELLSMGNLVDVICLQSDIPPQPGLTVVKAEIRLDFLQEFLAERYYDGIVNFMHYPNPEDYVPVHSLLTGYTDHLIFLSSYRVYADCQHPITETAPLLLDVSQDREFLAKEDYALAKAKAERFIQGAAPRNWTVVRPVISFSHLRFDLVTRSGNYVLEQAEMGEPMVLPREAKDKTAGLDWAGNSGKLIAGLLFKKEAFGEIYTVSSAQNLTWGQIAECYSSLLKVPIRWIDTEQYLAEDNRPFILYYDRLFDRKIDNSKILQATGLAAEEFVPIAESIERELAY